MTELEEARIDHAYACGMKQALIMAAQGAENKANEAAERRRAAAIKVIRAHQQDTSK